MRNKKPGYVPKEDRPTLKCRGCEQDLPISEFYKEGKTSAGKQKFSARCCKCYDIHASQTYTSSKQHAEKKQLARDIINNAKTQCEVCGYNRCSEALDFHHINPADKLFEIADANTQFWKRSKNGITLEDLEAEIKKCVVLCSNCHREHHAGVLNLDVFLRKEGI